jgi:putative Holliday junction resolvase
VGRVLGLDPGTRRIGVAVSDALGLTAQPLEVLEADDPATMDRIRELVADLGVETVVVGLPVGLDGSEGAAAAAARRFAGRVAEATGLPVHFQDERFSSVTAERVLLAAGLRRERRRRVQDRVAAAVFLQAYLDGRR